MKVGKTGHIADHNNFCNLAFHNEIHLVGNLRAVLIQRLEADPLGEGDASDSARLRAGDLAEPSSQEVLGHLG